MLQLKDELHRFNENDKDKIILFEFSKDNSQRHSIINLMGQGVVGSGFAFLSLIPPFAAAWANAWSSNISPTLQTTLFIVAVSSYIFSSSLGVYLVAKYENSNLSLLPTFGYSAIGGGFSLILLAILSTQYTTIPEFGGWVAALSPVIGSMVYASLVADWPIENNSITFRKSNLSHKEFYEQTKLFDIELLRINL
jgi:hypothetical protein